MIMHEQHQLHIMYVILYIYGQCDTGLQGLREISLHGCRNVVNTPGEVLPLLPHLTALTSLNMRNCDGLQDGALHCSALASLRHLDLSGETITVPHKLMLPSIFLTG